MLLYDNFLLLNVPLTGEEGPGIVELDARKLECGVNTL